MVEEISKNTYLYVSSWRKNGGDCGLSGYRFDTETGKLQWIETVEKDVAFHVTYFDQTRCLLYALEENDNLPGLRGGGGGRIFVFRIHSEKGTLTKICCKETWCSSPSYLTLDESGEFLIVSHHGSKAAVTKIGRDAYGNYYPVVERDDVAVELFSIREDGTLDQLVDVVKHTGSGPEKRQLTAHPHTAVRSPSGKLFAVCDKGNDTVRMYMLDREKKKLIRPKHVYQHSPGTLPRYCVFHPEKPWFYHNSESCMQLHAFDYTEDGVLREIGTSSALPPDCETREKAVEQQGLVMDHGGRYIYDIVRGPNVVTVFQVDQQDGSVRPVQHQPIRGRWPRGCALSPDGRFLLVCCLESETVVEFAIDDDGRLSETGQEYSNAAAAYAIFCEI